MPLKPGSKLGHYEVLSPIGAGAMGEVYRAKDLKLGRDVAIKVLPQEFASDSERLRRFGQEARAASALNHPNIITIHDIGEQAGTHYIAMELVEGKTLREVLEDGPVPTTKMLGFASQVAQGIAKAHAAGIVHRDLKPENLMVTNDGFVKILDFGLAKLLPHASDPGSQMATVSKMGTQVGVILGTVQYMSPEQAVGRTVDFRSDQFSFGSILYEMATGKRAFERESMAQTMTAIIESDPEPATSLNPNLPSHLGVIVKRCLAKRSERALRIHARASQGDRTCKRGGRRFPNEGPTMGRGGDLACSACCRRGAQRGRTPRPPAHYAEQDGADTTDDRCPPVREPRPFRGRVLCGRHDRRDHEPPRCGQRARDHLEEARATLRRHRKNYARDRRGAGGRLHPRWKCALGQRRRRSHPSTHHAGAHPRLRRHSAMV